MWTLLFCLALAAASPPKDVKEAEIKLQEGSTADAASLASLEDRYQEKMEATEKARLEAERKEGHIEYRESLSGNGIQSKMTIGELAALTVGAIIAIVLFLGILFHGLGRTCEELGASEEEAEANTRAGKRHTREQLHNARIVHVHTVTEAEPPKPTDTTQA